MPSLPCPSALQHANLYEWKLLQVPVSHSPPRLAPLAAHCNVGTRGDRRVPGIRSLYSSHAAASARAHLSRPSPPDATASPPPRSRDKFRYRQGRQEGCKQRLSSRNTHSEAETRGSPRRLARPRTHPWREVRLSCVRTKAQATRRCAGQVFQVALGLRAPRQVAASPLPAEPVPGIPGPLPLPPAFSGYCLLPSPFRWLSTLAAHPRPFHFPASHVQTPPP